MCSKYTLRSEQLLAHVDVHLCASLSYVCVSLCVYTYVHVCGLHNGHYECV